MLMILYVLKFLLFVLIMVSCGGLVWIMYMNKKILLENKKELFEFLIGRNWDYKNKSNNMNELSNIKKEEVESYEARPLSI